MSKVVVNVLYAPGTNSHTETLWAFSRVGADARLLLLREVLNGDAQLDNGDVMCIPGGFSFGDHMGAGSLEGQLLKHRLSEQFARVVQKPLLAICNGFQITMRAGVFGDGVTLLPNACGTFRNIMKQAHDVEQSTNSIWLKGLEGQRLYFSCAHGEGRLYVEDKDASVAAWHAALRYPEGQNPDGSQENIGGISTNNGMCLGLMDHPERMLDDEANLEIFRNGVRYAKVT